MSSNLNSLSDLLNMNVDEIKSDNGNDNDSDFSISQLDLLANKAKMIPQDDPVEIVNVDNVSVNSKEKKSSYTKSDYTKSVDSGIYNRSIESNPRKYEKQPRRVSKKSIEEENENPFVRREKSELISKINVINNETGSKYSGFLVNMDCSLYDLRNELQRLDTEIQNEQKVKMLRTGLSFTVQGLEWLNSAYDPVGIDLNGWANNLNIHLEAKQYDKVLLELYEKYFKGESNLPPEVKLLGMLLVSGAGYAVTKKIQNATQSKLEKMMESMKMRQEPRQEDIATDTVDDPMPSKMQQPIDNFDIGDVLKKMRRNDNTVDDNISVASSQDIFKSVDMTIKKRAGRGRPRKT